MIYFIYFISHNGTKRYDILKKNKYGAKMMSDRMRYMKYYEELLDYGCFTSNEVVQLVGNQNTAVKVIERLIKKGYIERVKKDLYVTINLADYEPTVNKYRIACEVTDTAVISHHSALEYYGIANQVYHSLIVSSSTRFKAFDFRGVHYERTSLSFNDGIENINHLAVTSVERTIVDCLHAPYLAGGIEEIIRSFRMIEDVDENKIKTYLVKYDKIILFQRAGYILELFKSSMHLSDSFFEFLKNCIPCKNIGYLDCSQKKDCIFNKQWNIMVPNQIRTTLTKGVEEDDI